MTLHMVEIRPHAVALFRFLETQGLNGREDEDLGYGVHAWLAAAFGELVPKPWRLFWDRSRPPRILAYSQAGAEKLYQHLGDFADPGASRVCPKAEDLVSRPMPTFTMGRRLGLELQCMPVIRKSRTGIEQDIFLQSQNPSSDRRRRDEVYCEWVQNQLTATGAVDVVGMNLHAFRLVHQLRRTRDAKGNRQSSRLIRPQVQVRGELVVRDATAFTKLLARGIGRHTAFGYGMLLLRPPS